MNDVEGVTAPARSLVIGGRFVAASGYRRRSIEQRAFADFRFTLECSEGTVVSQESDMISRIALILGSKAAQKIDFQLDQTRIVGSALTTVLASLNDFQAGKKGIRIDFGHVSPGGMASYDSKQNVIQLPKNPDFGVSIKHRVGLLHECIHAWLDLRMPKVLPKDPKAAAALKTTELSDEAVAYVAGALFYIYEYQPNESNPKLPDTWVVPIFSEAHRIAMKIMNKAGAIVSKADADELKQKIRDDYYELDQNPEKPSGNDGV